jgi:hypothetical protein
LSMCKAAGLWSISRPTADWPELVFDIFPVVPSEKGWEAYMEEFRQSPFL